MFAEAIKGGREMANVWDGCEHRWVWDGESECDTDVRCTKCGVPGQVNFDPTLLEMMSKVKDDADVFWPAT